MCGIVGYTGKLNAVEVVLSGLRKLEYRGYDSAGIAMLHDCSMDVLRAVGRVDALARKTANISYVPHNAIGHTRWASHGRPSEINAHPHCDNTGQIAVVHNGIVENYSTLRSELLQSGAKFLSETDTEVAAVLIGHLYKGNLVEAVIQATQRFEGTFALGVVCIDHPDMIVGARRGPPLAVGAADDGAMMLASDALPILPYTRNVCYLEDNQIVALQPGKMELYANGVQIEARLQKICWTAEESERGGYRHYMLKEIYEQPAVLRRLAANLVANAGSLSPVSPPTFNLDNFPLNNDALRKLSRVVIVAQGTAFHAGLIGRNMIERTVRIPVSVEYGSDFQYRDPVIDPSVLVISVSQSGETADTLGAVRLAKERGCTTLAIINTVGSTIARESHGVIYMHAGLEIGVASTKAFTAQIAALYVLAIHIGLQRGTLSDADAVRRVADLLQVASRVDEALACAEQVKAVALKYKDSANALFLGRGTGFPLALEGALKLKEISYVHAEGYDAAEMKHGPIALIDERMPVIVLALKGRRYDKIISNIQEVKARGGRVIVIASHDDTEIADKVDDVIRVHDDRGIMNSIVCAIPFQLFAYEIAVARNCDVDKPRNLAKSLTIE